MSSLNIQTDRPQHHYMYFINGRSQVVTGVEFNCVAAVQGVHRVYILFNKRRRLATEGLNNLTGWGLRESNSVPLLFTQVSNPRHQRSNTPPHI